MKKESVGTTFLTTRVWLVSAEPMVRIWSGDKGSGKKEKLTFIALFLCLDFYGQIFAFLPLDRGTFGPVVNKVAGIAHFILVVICFFEQGVLKELFGAFTEVECKLEAWLAVEI